MSLSDTTLLALAIAVSIGFFVVLIPAMFLVRRFYSKRRVQSLPSSPAPGFARPQCDHCQHPVPHEVDHPHLSSLAPTQSTQTVLSPDPPSGPPAHRPSISQLHFTEQPIIVRRLSSSASTDSVSVITSVVSSLHASTSSGIFPSDSTLGSLPSETLATPLPSARAPDVLGFPLAEAVVEMGSRRPSVFSAGSEYSNDSLPVRRVSAGGREDILVVRGASIDPLPSQSPQQQPFPVAPQTSAIPLPPRPRRKSRPHSLVRTRSVSAHPADGPSPIVPTEHPFSARSRSLSISAMRRTPHHPSPLPPPLTLAPLTAPVTAPTFQLPPTPTFPGPHKPAVHFASQPPTPRPPRGRPKSLLTSGRRSPPPTHSPWSAVATAGHAASHALAPRPLPTSVSTMALKSAPLLSPSSSPFPPHPPPVPTTAPHTVTALTPATPGTAWSDSTAGTPSLFSAWRGFPPRVESVERAVVFAPAPGTGHRAQRSVSPQIGTFSPPLPPPVPATQPISPTSAAPTSQSNQPPSAPPTPAKRGSRITYRADVVREEEVRRRGSRVSQDPPVIPMPEGLLGSGTE